MFVLGSMLPDFASMIRARPPRVAHEELARGVAFHHRTDGAFHDSVTFRRLTSGAFVELEAAGVRRSSARAVAHVGTEILLDAELAREPEAREVYYRAVRAADATALGTNIEWRDGAERERFDALVRALTARSTGYAEPGIAELAWRIERALHARPRLALDAAGAALVQDWVPAALLRVAGTARALLDEVRAGLGAPAMSYAK